MELGESVVKVTMGVKYLDVIFDQHLNLKSYRMAISEGVTSKYTKVKVYVPIAQ